MSIDKDLLDRLMEGWSADDLFGKAAFSRRSSFSRSAFTSATKLLDSCDTPGSA